MSKAEFGQCNSQTEARPKAVLQSVVVVMKCSLNAECIPTEIDTNDANLLAKYISGRYKIQYISTYATKISSKYPIQPNIMLIYAYVWTACLTSVVPMTAQVRGCPKYLLSLFWGANQSDQTGEILTITSTYSTCPNTRHWTLSSALCISKLRLLL